MPPYIQNYGFTKTLFQDDDNNEINNMVKWEGDYDGKLANIDIDINDNGKRKLVSMQLNNNDIRNMFGIKPVEGSLEKRLTKDFLHNTTSKSKYKPITLEGALIKPKSYSRSLSRSLRHRKKGITKSKSKRRRQHIKTRKIYYN
jgi:hypothetical protein